MTDQDDLPDAPEWAPFEAGYLQGCEAMWEALGHLMFHDRKSRVEALALTRGFIDNELWPWLAATVERARDPLLVECEAIAAKAWENDDER